MTAENASLPKCPLWRRLAAALYDALLQFGVLGVAATVALPFTGDLSDGRPHPVFSIYLFMVSFFFFGWFWTHGGQTLGMKVWNIRVQNRAGGPITLWQAALRFLVAIASWGALGLGFLWSLVDKEKLTWHDRYSMRDASAPEQDAAVRDLVVDRAAFDDWAMAYRGRLAQEASVDAERAARMNRVNPKYVLRNHLVEIAIGRARGDDGPRDFSEVARLLAILSRPFDEQPEHEAYAAEPPDWARALHLSCSS